MFNIEQYRKSFLIIFMVLNALTARWAVAGDPQATPDELKRLPDWCVTASSVNAFKKKMEPSGCGGLHHYCWALVWSDRKSSAGSYFYGDAISDLKYVISHSKNSCAMLPIVYLRMGDVYSQSGNHESAIGYYRHAINANPKLIMAYSGMSRAFVMLGTKQKAIDALKEGLKANPNNSLLSKRLEWVESLSEEAPKTP
ncbi:MAG: tetratricopeptide repeat protein [Chromatiales bacterium]|nr:tetratricopeptide repeat protein [Chromatiales bacterium]